MIPKRWVPVFGQDHAQTDMTPMWPAKALEGWRDFYLLVGTAGATLVALLFVAVSLGAGYLNPKHTAATRTFFSPVVIHFTAVFFISAIAMAPSQRPLSLSVLVGATALIGAAVSGFTIFQMIRNRWTDNLEDRLAYGLLPVAAYAALIGAAVMIFVERESSLDVLAGALLLLLIVNIRNAWDLMLDMVRRHTGRD